MYNHTVLCLNQPNFRMGDESLESYKKALKVMEDIMNGEFHKGLASVMEAEKVKDEDVKEWMKERVESARKSAENVMDRYERLLDRRSKIALAEEERSLTVEKLKHEKEETVKLELQLKIKQNELEQEKVKLGVNVQLDSGSRSSTSTPRLPKLPTFLEDKDRMDAFLSRFEMIMSCHKIKDNQWCMHLSSCLTGHALELFFGIAVEKQQDYAEVKATLLKGYNLTEKSFKDKFWNSRARKDEIPSQVLNRINEYFEQWLKLNKVSTFGGLKELVVKKQF